MSDSAINQLIYAAPAAAQNNTRQLAQGTRIGEQITSVNGSGSDFSEVRAYHSGDELRHIDWRATARSRVPLVRTYHSEFSQPICLLIDRRASMRFATRVRLKVTQALRMALWIAGREARSGREISAVLLDNPCHWLPPVHGMSGLKLLAKRANAPCPPIDADDLDAYTPEWSKILSGLRQRIPEGSELILLTDLFALKDSDSKILRIMGQHCTTRAIHIFDPSEVSSTFSAPLQLQWGSRRQYVSLNNSASAQLKRDLQARTSTISQLLRQANISYYQLSVEQDELATIGMKVLL
ncbi:MAG: DUF58 domain-containing protein [gamma proteobacterium symbiont of Bathyaustriella thionipta]|nr:DUF58 domain-containing protein [gamma proteobacterium symbiont of Bathyaustriella thionipta]MCU7954942.1 DUF58 domain-containing protein [gamma proteobacterium symbiont of Bathyaustriella thionipta]MCU7956447.1 DUF58 domain-containing protein [gamma proteobacterium symbiont of Bathyaustriella thionipta]MCU7966918.1 DUF58 domain-containing protein [gamma proteobacterium symbiont of Bathyaustriella thionipta]